MKWFPQPNLCKGCFTLKSGGGYQKTIQNLVGEGWVVMNEISEIRWGGANGGSWVFRIEYRWGRMIKMSLELRYTV